jgi:phosphoglycolate phosphatase-like HAD superfamily hydrolase
MLRKALDWLHVSADAALYVGDMVVDILTGLGAGVRVWVVPTGSDDLATLETAGPDRILRDLHELAVVLQESS